MSNFEIDPGAWKDADDNLDFPVYDQGWYALRVEEAEEAETKTGKPYLKVKYEIIGGPEQDNGNDVEGKSVTDMIFFKDFGNPTDYGVRKLKNLIQRSGVDLGRGKNAYTLASIAGKLDDSEAEVLGFLTRQYRQKKVLNDATDEYEYVDDPDSGEENRITKYDVIEKQEAYVK